MKRRTYVTHHLATDTFKVIRDEEEQIVVLALSREEARRMAMDFIDLLGEAESPPPVEGADR